MMFCPPFFILVRPFSTFPPVSPVSYIFVLALFFPFFFLFFFCSFFFSFFFQLYCSVAFAGTCQGLRDVWEATSFQLERLQAAPDCVVEEEAGLSSRAAPVWRLPWEPSWGPPRPPEGSAIRVAVLRSANLPLATVETRN